MTPGDVVVIALPRFAAGGQTKRRPCLVLTNLPGSFQNALVCGISSEIEELESGLVKPSSIRLSYLDAVDQSDVAGRIGDLSPQRLEKLVTRLAAHLIG